MIRPGANMPQKKIDAETNDNPDQKEFFWHTLWNPFDPWGFSGLAGNSTKALNGIHWKVAHPLMFNYGAPIASMNATMCVRGEGTS